MRTLAAAVFGALLLLVILAGCAEAVARQDSATALEQALRLERWTGGQNTQHLEGLAALSDDPGSMFERAVRENPRLSSAWMALGLEQERRGGFDAAERSLLTAAHFDRQYLPAWTLANFYFRRGREEPFWQWAAQATARTYDDFRPLLRLADRFSSDPAFALARLEAVSGDARVERAYLDFVIGENRLAEAEFTARRLLARGEPDDRRRVADLVTREIRAHREQPALELWNAIEAPLDGARGPVLANGDFERAPSGVGFDWDLRQNEGILAEWFAGRLAFTFSGQSSGPVVLLERAVPVVEGKRYVLHAEIEKKAGPGGPARAGAPALHWELGGGFWLGGDSSQGILDLYLCG